MYCHKCGQKNPDEALYCHSCGTQISDLGMPVKATSQAQIVASDTKTFHKPTVIVIAMALIAVILIAVVFILVIERSGLQSNTITYGSSQNVQILNTTRITMYGDDNKPLSDYDIASIDSSGGLNTFHVSEDSFTPQDLGVSDKTYRFIVNNNDNSDEMYATPIITVVPEGSSSSSGNSNAIYKEELQIRPPGINSSSTADEKQTAIALYYGKILEYEKNYGRGSLKTVNGSTYLIGLCFAKLIDFNDDGLDELYLCYYTGMKEHDPVYEAELFSAKDGKLISLFKAPVVASPGPAIYTIIADIDGTRYAVSGEEDMGLTLDLRSVEKDLSVKTTPLTDHDPEIRGTGTFGNKSISRDEIARLRTLIDSSPNRYFLLIPTFVQTEPSRTLEAFTSTKKTLEKEIIETLKAASAEVKIEDAPQKDCMVVTECIIDYLGGKTLYIGENKKNIREVTISKEVLRFDLDQRGAAKKIYRDYYDTSGAFVTTETTVRELNSDGLPTKETLVDSINDICTNTYSYDSIKDGLPYKYKDYFEYRKYGDITYEFAYDNGLLSTISEVLLNYNHDSFHYDFNYSEKGFPAKIQRTTKNDDRAIQTIELISSDKDTEHYVFKNENTEVTFSCEYNAEGYPVRFHKNASNLESEMTLTLSYEECKDPYPFISAIRYLNPWNYSLKNMSPVSGYPLFPSF